MTEATPESPSQIRNEILEQHREIEALLARVEEVAKRVLEQDFAKESRPGAIRELRELASDLYQRFERHLDFEDRHLVPALREADAWGEERARRVECEHRDQRALLAFLIERLEDAGQTSSAMAHQLRGFVATVRDDMAHEEKAVLSDKILRDDVVSIDAFAG